MSRHVKKILLVLLAVALLFGSSRVQQAMNRDRQALGLTTADVLENAPPVLAFTTVALGGFRGLISNALWIRANNLQENDKFFEAAQLADWITKLEPHFPQVWVHQAWNMAYNISVKFKDYPDRWNWVQRGIELLRDEGLKFNPNDVLIHRELAWLFQNKMGANLDDAGTFYKQAWAYEMALTLPTGHPDFDRLLDPQTDEEKERARVIREKYKLDPALMKRVDERWGPLEWRLPDAQAIYWGSRGLEKAAENPTKVKRDDLLMLHRVIYQSMQLVVLRGRLVPGVVSNTFDLAPNLDAIQRTSDAYEEAIKEDFDARDSIKRAHRNMIRMAVYFLYQYNRMREANEWFQYLVKNYPNDNLITGRSGTKPTEMTLEEYAVARVQEDVKDASPERTKAAISGLLEQSYYNLVVGEDDRAVGFKNLARAVWRAYQSNVPENRMSATGLLPFEQMNQMVLNALLSPTSRWPFEVRAILRSRLGMGPETPLAPEPETTTTAPTAVSTNSPLNNP